MMPLTLAGVGEKNVIGRVGGSEETRRFLGNLGIITGAEITVISAIGGNVIVNVKDSRVAINEDMARHILI
ncbi:FeoA family protein [uncultured Cloacibacillus sp.]|uniref:FeoA family protein n=1 Tax=uncultured Cloacibacillus sp. TaxID=889794 RepID=UPI00320916AA